MLRTSKEKLALYIGTNYGDDSCQEWVSEKQLVLLEPITSQCPMDPMVAWETKEGEE